MKTLEDLMQIQKSKDSENLAELERILDEAIHKSGDKMIEVRLSLMRDLYGMLARKGR